MLKRIEYNSPVTAFMRLFVSSIYVERDMNNDLNVSLYALMPYLDLEKGVPKSVEIPKSLFDEIRIMFEENLVVLLNGIKISADEAENVYRPDPSSLWVEAFEKEPTFS